MNLLVVCRLKEIQVYRKLEPLSVMDEVETIYLVRREPVALKKVKNYCPPELLRKTVVTAELYRILIIAYLLAFKRVDAIMGIFLIPHGIIAGVLGALFRKPVIQNIIGIDLHHALESKLLFTFIKNADIVITRGPLTKQILADRKIEPQIIFTPPNVFDFDKIPVLEGSSKIYDLIFVGSLERYKRLDLLLEALRIVKTEYKLADVKLAIVGDGSLRGSLQQLAGEYGIVENISFLGSQKDVYSYLYQSKVFIMTSEAEGLPMAMIEAMSCGLPCIVPDDSDITSVAVDNYNALVVPVGDTGAFASRIHRLLTDESLLRKLSANAQSIRREKRGEYSLENITGIWKQILHQIGV